MKRPGILLPAFSALTLLSACGGGGGGGGSLDALAAEFAALNGDPTIASLTPNSTVDAMNGSATYDGVINIGTDDPLNPAGAAFYYGNLSLSVNFTSANVNDTVTGNAGGFVQYFSEIASPKTGNGVPGTLTMVGTLTGDNENLSDGMAGSAWGTIDGSDVLYDFDGNITGLTGNAAILYFDGTNAVSSGGVAIVVD